MQFFTTYWYAQMDCVTDLWWRLCRNSAPAVEERLTHAQPAARHAEPQAPPSTQGAWEGVDQEQQSADPPHQQPQAQPSSPRQPRKMKSKPTVPFAGKAASVRKF